MGGEENLRRKDLQKPTGELYGELFEKKEREENM